MWIVIERRIGRAGSKQEREAKQRAWDRRYGEGRWSVGYILDGAFLPYEDALERIYQASYEAYLDAHPEEMEELLRLAKVLRNPHAEATTGADLQLPAIHSFLQKRNLRLQGTEVVDIGSWQGRASHPISIRLSPLTIPCVADPSYTLEAYWQEKKCLATWQEEGQDGDPQTSRSRNDRPRPRPPGRTR